MIWLRRTWIRRTKFYSQQGKCIYQDSVSTYCSKLSVELSFSTRGSCIFLFPKGYVLSEFHCTYMTAAGIIGESICIGFCIHNAA